MKRENEFSYANRSLINAYLMTSILIKHEEEILTYLKSKLSDNIK